MPAGWVQFISRLTNKGGEKQGGQEKRWWNALNKSKKKDRRGSKSKRSNGKDKEGKGGKSGL